MNVCECMNQLILKVTGRRGMKRRNSEDNLMEQEEKKGLLEIEGGFIHSTYKKSALPCYATRISWSFHFLRMSSYFSAHALYYN
jgi:hypothetical protein